nr:unnamed protein product [Naegleria fowleri]
MNHLRQLSLEFTSLRKSDVQILCRCESLKYLISLNVDMNHFESEGVTFISECENMKNLTRLNVYFNGVNSEGVKALTKSPFMAHLTELNLGDNDHLGSESIECLVQSPFLKELKILDLSENMIGTAGVKALTTMTTTIHSSSDSLFIMGCLNQLTHLNLSFDELCSEDVSLLANCEHLRNLRKLLLRGNSILSEGVKYLSESSCKLRCLELLDLSENLLDEESVDYFANSENFQYLTELYVTNDHFLKKKQDDDLENLCIILKQSAYLKNLTTVDILNIDHSDLQF